MERARMPQSRTRSPSLARLARIASLALALPLSLAAAAPAMADGPTVAPGDTLLSLSAEGKVSRAPDMATVSAGVTTTGRTAAAAMSANAAAMSRAISALKAAGLADRDVQTSAINLSPAFAQAAPNQPNDAAPRITGYTASNNITVRARDLTRLGKLIDALIGAGANDINGPSFGVTDSDTAMDAAREDAMAKVRARAALYARTAGLKVLRILTISEDSGEVMRPMPMLMMAKLAMDSAPTPVAAGEIDLTARITVAFELAP